MRKSGGMVAVVLLVLAGGSCDQLGIQAQKTFSMDAFEDNILAAFTTQSVGFSYIILQDGQVKRSDAVGAGRTTIDGPRLMVKTDSMHVASVSKTITTAAVLRLLQDTPGVDLDSSIASFLPAGWNPGPGISNLTFRELLSHRSGFDIANPPTGAGETDAGLQAWIADGVKLSKNPPGVYSNAHHAMMRVIIPYLWGDAPLKEGTESFPEWHSRVYQAYVKQVVFDPAGITGAPVASSRLSNLYYPFPHNGINGVGANPDDFDFSLRVGGYGWYLSVMDLGRFLAYLRFTDDILNEESRQVMASQELGWWNTRSPAEGADYGTYLGKQGSWYIYDSQSTAQGGSQAFIGNYAEKVQAAVILNSQPIVGGSPSGLNLGTIMMNAFDNAFL